MKSKREARTGGKMDTPQNNNSELIEKIEVQEAGVAELGKLYEQIESIYVEASQSLSEELPIFISNSCNPTR